jgi:hypothetical protein
MKLLPKLDVHNNRAIQGSYALNTLPAIRPALRAQIVPYIQDYDRGFRVCRGVR